MMNNNKILTVSYGTFSCTLEGFDDSFDTMKAIAEYFRDLASDDRYFGAEPPQPDAEMLAKIAEREVARRVEAREHEGRIMLKAHEEEATPAVAAVAAAAPEAPAETPDDQPEALSEEQATVPETALAVVQEEATEESAAAFFADSPSVEDVPEENEGTEDISVEVFTNYIPAVDAVEDEAFDTDDSAEDTAEEVPSEQETITEGTGVETAVGKLAEDYSAVPASGEAQESDVEDDVAEQAVYVVEQEDVAEEITDAQESAVEEDLIEQAEYLAQEEDVTEEIEEIAAAQGEETADAPTDDVITPEDAAAASMSLFTGESFTDKLQRIRDVVSQRNDADKDDVYEEDMDAPADMDSFEKMPAFEDASEIDEASEQSVDETKNLAAADAAFDIENALAFDDDQDDATDHDTDDDLDSILDRIETASAEGDADADEQESTGTETENIFGAVETEVQDSDEVTGKDEEVSVDGRILKINRSALDAALKSGELEEYEDDSLAEATALSADKEQELQRELAAAEEDAAAQEGGKPAARESLPQIDDSAENDVSRLMAEADEQMDEPEGKTRRSAFAHLRAAVAARFADRSMDKDAAQAEEEEAEVYRSDLAEVVKPRRPGSEHEGDQRSGTERPSPLKLVAEQRIDPSDLVDVAPRRVAAATDEDLILEEDSGFADYAEDRGAHSLPEVLEAAAAYLCYVEGVEHFSRPQLMSRVKQADCGEFTREDGLRAFGQLLRTGKIEKIKGGRFVASEAIGFKPGHRAAG